MFGLYELVEVVDGVRRRSKLVTIYKSEQELMDVLENLENIGDYKVELMGNSKNVIKVPAKKVNEAFIRNRLDELGFSRHSYSGILFDGTTCTTIPSSALTNTYEVPDNCQFGLITHRYNIKNNNVYLETVNSRIADTESLHNTLNREEKNTRLALVGFNSPMDESEIDDVFEDILVE